MSSIWKPATSNWLRVAKQSKLDNGQEPLPPTLSEAETAFVESFLQDILSIFPLLGLGVFEKTETIKRPIRMLTIESKGIKASGYEDAKGFVVLKGSQVVKDEVPSINQSPHLTALRKDLLSQGVIVDNGSNYVFTQDQVFQSPSTTAGVIQWRSANGRLDWRNSEGKSLKELQEVAAKEDHHDV